MTICPWCGTSYTAFQPNCSNCGGVMTPAAAANPDEALSPPPPAPRPISDGYARKLFLGDGAWPVFTLVFGILGVVFSLVGAGLILGVITAFVGVPFLMLGTALLIAAVWIFILRYKEARMVVNVLREGEAATGQIVDTQINYAVRVNGRNPWVIRYNYRVYGHEYESRVSTYNPPGPQIKAGNPVYVLFLPAAPQRSSIYPHP